MYEFHELYDKLLITSMLSACFRRSPPVGGQVLEFILKFTGVCRIVFGNKIKLIFQFVDKRIFKDYPHDF